VHPFSSLLFQTVGRASKCSTGREDVNVDGCVQLVVGVSSSFCGFFFFFFSFFFPPHGRENVMLESPGIIMNVLHRTTGRRPFHNRGDDFSLFSPSFPPHLTGTRAAADRSPRPNGTTGRPKAPSPGPVVGTGDKTLSSPFLSFLSLKKNPWGMKSSCPRKRCPGSSDGCRNPSSVTAFLFFFLLFLSPLNVAPWLRVYREGPDDGGDLVSVEETGSSSTWPQAPCHAPTAMTRDFSPSPPLPPFPPLPLCCVRLDSVPTHRPPGVRYGVEDEGMDNSASGVGGGQAPAFHFEDEQSSFFPFPVALQPEPAREEGSPNADAATVSLSHPRAGWDNLSFFSSPSPPHPSPRGTAPDTSTQNPRGVSASNRKGDGAVGRPVGHLS